ncbi:MAG TPA: hypothetical protein VGO34_15205 [Alphaproteobacteria bacterium]|jgi:hypothetical protein
MTEGSLSGDGLVGMRSPGIGYRNAPSQALAMTDADPALGDMFGGGPFGTLEKRLGLVAPDRPRVYRRALAAVAVSWLPLLILSLIGGTLLASPKGFVWDFAVHARYLVAVPLLVFAERTCMPRLSAIARHFLDTGLVPERERSRFVAAALSTARWRDSVRVEMAIAILAYALTGILMTSVQFESSPIWQRHVVGGVETFTLAGWWHSLVSTPLLLGLLLWWFWRMVLWSRFLWLVSRLELQLIPAHPDHAAGLMFAGYSVRACGILGFALGVIVAGTMANQVFHDGATLLSLRYVPIGLVAVNIVAFCAPLACFSVNLLHAWRRGTFEYGALAGGLGRQFERKWLNRKEGIEPDALDVQHFSATTDLYSIVSNVYAMHFVPLDLKSLLYMAVATLLPFLPVVILATSLDAVLEGLAGLFF